MSSSDEEELVTDKTLSKDKEQEESDSSESNDTADNLEQAKKAMNLELTKLSKLSRNERTAIDLELHDYDKESLSPFNAAIRLSLSSVPIIVQSLSLWDAPC